MVGVKSTSSRRKKSLKCTYGGCEECLGSSGLVGILRTYIGKWKLVSG